VDVALVLLTAALVATTAVYSYFTRRMADEMGKSREQALRPRLGLYVRAYGPTGGHLTLRSLGPGAALDIGVTLTFDPPGETREWHAPLLPPGEEAEFMFPTGENGRLRGFKELETLGAKAGVSGSMRDVSGGMHEIEEHVDVASWAKVLTDANQRYVRSPADIVASEIKKIREAVETAARALHR
jgi:hypothetical protein